MPAPQGAAKPSVYGRFIPREELSEFAAWSPGAFGGQAAPALGVQRPAPPAPPQPSPEEELQALLAANRQQAYQDGYRDGLQALEGFKQTHARQLSTQVGALLQSIGMQLDEMQQEMARTLALAASNLARQILREELTLRPERVAGVAAEAVDALLLSARHITLRVHPDDHALVSQGASEVLAARGGRVLTDASVSRGGCLVDSDIGGVDASMETRWARAVAAIEGAGDWNAADATPAAAAPQGDA
ncbi:flagellar assembly protein FliH [Piscinibacter sakaiensis]|uniref:Flagellar assembly protein FliH n=1 Tax=Piscinibacter sakaiensis TaxID=1547922 RepID=A0A0K8P6J5_PISS1|nr:flagellar assembly protein FliH [Piscinibacter sakaiensis]